MFSSSHGTEMIFLITEFSIIATATSATARVSNKKFSWFWLCSRIKACCRLLETDLSKMGDQPSYPASCPLTAERLFFFHFFVVLLLCLRAV